jgi:putative acetyltransferase
VSGFSIETDDPRRPDVIALLERHLVFCRATSPPEHTFALDLPALLDPGITFFSLRRGGELLGIGALKELDPTHGEIKSMHTAAEARGIGVARAIVEHLLATAAARGYARVSLETGTMDAFAPARNLYANAGFAPCEPFGDYIASPNNAFMTLELAARGRRPRPRAPRQTSA